VTDAINAVVVLAIRRERRSYSGIERTTLVKKRTAINILHWAESRVGKNVKFEIENLLNKQNGEPTFESGHTPSLSDQDKSYLIPLVERLKNCHSILSVISDISGLQISRETVRKILKVSSLY
jgi:hypothetical protein